jgi:hypothetical protein
MILNEKSLTIKHIPGLLVSRGFRGVVKLPIMTRKSTEKLGKNSKVSSRNFQGGKNICAFFCIIR